MKAMVLASLLCLGACSNRDCNPGTSVEDFSGTNLLLDKYMTDKCFNLVHCDDSACTQMVYSFREGDIRMTNEEWAWEYLPPNLYIIDEYELDVYHSLDNAECWDLEAFALDLKAEACPCPYLPLIDRKLP
tara:strand:- start:2387 stop:2779 length:393 start_codon:yes stop_codon:yes gene_type:complete